MIKLKKIKVIKFKIIQFQLGSYSSEMKYLLQLVVQKYTLQQIKHNEIALSLAQLSPQLFLYLLQKSILEKHEFVFNPIMCHCIIDCIFFHNFQRFLIFKLMTWAWNMDRNWSQQTPITSPQQNFPLPL